jgi:hypothetical protein
MPRAPQNSVANLHDVEEEIQVSAKIKQREVTVRIPREAGQIVDELMFRGHCLTQHSDY